LGKPRYSPKKSRGKPFKIDDVGRAVMLYQSAEGGSAGSALSHAGEGDGGGGVGDGWVNMLSEIGRALAVVRRSETKKGAAPPAMSRLEKRFQAYVNMLEARNELPMAEYQAEHALIQYDLGLVQLADVQEAEERLELTKEKLRQAKKENDRLRRGSLYAEQVGLMREQLRLRGLKF